MSDPLNPVTGSLKVTSKDTGAAFVGSAWPAAWLIVTVGASRSIVTSLSVLIDAGLGSPLFGSVPTPAGIDATTVPDPVAPLTVNRYVVELTWVRFLFRGPGAVLPARLMSPTSNPLTGMPN